MKVIFSTSFKRSLKRHIKRDSNLEVTFREKLAMFQNDPFDPSLRTHNLKGNLAGSSAFRLTYALRVVFKLTDEGHALFSDIGTHDEVY